MSKTLHRNLQAKIAALQGPEWESSDEEGDQVIHDIKGGKQKSAVKKKTEKSISKRKVEIEKDGEEEQDVSVVYIGHLPSEFEERDLRNFLMQFGRVERIRISRSVKSGKPRGYAFVKFTDAEVAKIVAETLQGYFLGSRRLVCHLVPDAHPRMFYDTDKVIARRKVQQEVQKKQRNRNLNNVQKLKEITARLVSREKKKRSKFAELGIDYDFPGYEANVEEVDQLEVGKKRKNSRDETTLMQQVVEEQEAVEEAASPKKKRKDSVDSTSSRNRKDSIGSGTSPAKKSKRKDSVGSLGNVGKRKDSVESETSAGSKQKKNSADDSIADTATEKKSKRKNSESSFAEKSNTATPSKKVQERTVQSNQKKSKKKNKRRVSAP